jgi:hypothetical protein
MMNEWALALALSLSTNAIMFIRLRQLRHEFMGLLTENQKLWHSNQKFNAVVYKLRTELNKERSHATLYRDRVSED